MRLAQSLRPAGQGVDRQRRRRAGGAELQHSRSGGRAWGGAIIQNAIGLNQAGEIASHCDTIWVDVVGTVRTVYGFPTEVVQAEGAVDRYAADGFLQTNPFARPAAFLLDWLQSVSELSATALKTAVGVDLSGASRQSSRRGFATWGSVGSPRRLRSGTNCV